jgi:hypothetical protein
MGKFVSKSEAENIILKYLVKQTEVSFKKFNQAQLTSKAIAKNTDLDLDIVNETLEALGQGAARVEKAVCNFEFWLPVTDEGEKIKKQLFGLNLASSNLTLFTFISVIVLFFVLKWTINQRWLTITTSTAYFFSGVVLAVISTVIAKTLANKYYLMSQRIQEVKYFPVYMWSFIVFTSLLIYGLSKGWENSEVIQKIILGISFVANLVTIISYFIAFKRK